MNRAVQAILADCGCEVLATGGRRRYCRDHALLRAAHLLRVYADAPLLADACERERRRRARA